MANPSKELKVRYQQDLMIWRTPLLRAGLLTLLFLYILSPIIWESFVVTKFLDDIGLTMPTLNYAGVFAVGAVARVCQSRLGPGADPASQHPGSQS